MKIFKQMFIANIKELVRDKSAIFWFLAFPVIFIFIFGIIFSNDTSQINFNIGISTENSNNITESIISSLEQVPNFDIHEDEFDSEIENLKTGKRSLVIKFPEIDESDFSSKESIDILIFYDATKQQTNQILISAINQVFNEIERNITGQHKIFNTIQESVLTQEMSDFDYILPGILGMAIMQLGLFGSLTFLNLREKKIVRGLGVTPLPRSILLGSEILVRLIVAFIQSFIIIILGTLVFNVNMTGNYLLLIGLIGLGAITFISLGYMLISFVKTEEAGNGLIQVVQFPMMFLSGVFFSLELMPNYIKPLVRILPLTYFGDALRQTMVGYGYYSMTTNVLVLVAWALFSMLMAIKFWSWD